MVSAVKEFLVSVTLGVFLWYLICSIPMAIYIFIDSISDGIFDALSGFFVAGFLYMGPVLALSFFWVGIPVSSAVVFGIRTLRKQRKQRQEQKIV